MVSKIVDEFYRRGSLGEFNHNKFRNILQMNDIGGESGGVGGERFGMESSIFGFLLGCHKYIHVSVICNCCHRYDSLCPQIFIC